MSAQPPQGGGRPTQPSPGPGRPPIVEVTSPSTEARDRGLKLHRCRHYGVAEYRIVDPDRRTVEAWRLAEDAEEAVVVGEGDVLTWLPVAGGRTLELLVEGLFEPLD